MIIKCNGCQIETEDVVLFFGKASVLSNFYPATFTLNAVEYNCVEQYIQSQKALHIGASTTAQRILHASNPYTQKYLGRQAKGDITKWTAVSKEEVERGVREKFYQNPDLADILLSTGDRTLGEACFDRLYGIGLSIKDARSLDPAKWRGNNIMGNTLMRVRNQLTQRSFLADYNSPPEPMDFELSVDN